MQNLIYIFNNNMTRRTYYNLIKDVYIQTLLEVLFEWT